MSWPGVGPSGYIYHSTQDDRLIGAEPIGGDVFGGLKTTIVSGIWGLPFQSGVPSSGDYFRFDGSQWAFSSGQGGGIGPHDLLGIYHVDTIPHSPSEGDLIVGTTGTLWDALPVGPEEYVIRSNGTTIEYVRLGQSTKFENGTAALPSVTFSGDNTAGLYSVSSGVLGLSANGILQLQIDGINDVATLDFGQNVKIRSTSSGITLGKSDYVVFVTAAPTTIDLDPSPNNGQIHYIKDSDGNATNPNPVTIDGNGNTIDGNATIKIRQNYGSFTLIYNGTQWNIV